MRVPDQDGGDVAHRRQQPVDPRSVGGDREAQQRPGQPGIGHEGPGHDRAVTGARVVMPDEEAARSGVGEIDVRARLRRTVHGARAGEGGERLDRAGAAAQHEEPQKARDRRPGRGEAPRGRPVGGGHVAHRPHQAEGGEQPDAPVHRIDLPPGEPAARRAGKAVMVVVPAFAQQQEPEQGMVGGAIGGRVAPGPEAVADVVDRRGAVHTQQAERQAVADREPGEAAREPDEADRGQTRDERPAVQPAQLRIPPQVRGRRDQLALRVVVVQQVTDPGRPQAVAGAHPIVRRVRPAVVMAVAAREADGVGEARGRQEPQQQLHRTAGLERAVGEVAMERPAQGERHQSVAEEECDRVAPGERAPRQTRGRDV